MVRLSLDRDFSRFLEKEPFPHSIQVCIGESRFTASGMILAQQSSVLESKMVEENGVIMLEELVDVGSDTQKYDCFRYLYGAPINFSSDSIELYLKFSSVYKVEDMFNKTLKWVKTDLSCRNFHRYHKLSKHLSGSHYAKDYVGTIKEFISNNAFECATELMEVLISQQVVECDCITAVLMCSPENGGALLSKWVLNPKNIPEFLTFSKHLNFLKLYPDQLSFTSFLGSITESSESVETMKAVLEMQKDYFTAFAQQKMASSINQSKSAEASNDKSDTRSTTSKAKSKKAKAKKATEKAQSQDTQKKANNSGEKCDEGKKSKDKNDQPDTSSSEAKLQSARRIVIKNLPAKANKDEINKAFTNYGAVTSVKLVPPSGCAFVDFRSIKTTKKIYSLVNADKDAITVVDMPVHVVPLTLESQQQCIEALSDPERKIVVKDLPADVTAVDLYSAFAVHGQFKDVIVAGGNVILEFSTAKGAKKIINMLKNGHKFLILDTAVSVSLASSSSEL